MDTILIVDDSPIVCSVLSAWLDEVGYRVTTAGTASSALRQVAEEPPSLIILDLLLPDLSGIEVCRRLKHDDATTRIPVVVMTSAGSTANRILCLEIGAEDFLAKPVIHEELIARVRSLLRAKHLSDRLLVSYYELDKLGHFAETFSSQSVADWSALEVANNMARHLLGPEPDHPNHPRVGWAGQEVRSRILGSVWYYESGEWMQEATQFARERLREVLAPHARGDGQFISKGPPAAALSELLHIPPSVQPANFVALWTGPNVVLAASYPWEVGAYEIPLLRSLIRHWAVFERIRFEARLAEQAFFSTMEALALAAEFHDQDTANHIRRVSAYSRLLAETLGCAPRFVKWVATAAPMHDVGKITIPVALLNKPATLTTAEEAIVRRHTVNGAELLGNLPPLETARSIARHHHESYDGSGYPDGLQATEIPLEARIVKLADVYDALRTQRPYKRAYSHDEAVGVMHNGDDRVIPGHFDPRLLTSFLDLHHEVARIYEAMSATPGRGGAGAEQA